MHLGSNVLAVLTAQALLTGCGKNPDVDALKANAEQQGQQIAALRAEVDQQKQRIVELSAKLSALEETVAQKAAAASGPAAQRR